MECNTIADLAVQLNLEYGATIDNISKKRFFRKGEKSQIFLGIVKGLYERYRDKFLYGNDLIGFKTFKSDVISAQKRIKKNQKNIKNIKENKVGVQLNIWNIDPYGYMTTN